ncbi:MAG: bidirectional hydrogenase complex protein HoxE [Candidatus Omnitrophica bacterium]|nr:NADP-reducing hydrogenase subunit HndA [bacterium]NUN95513.1 bidirectional hydrogenase complex protein HoxE [Candidatus Omnitrophota bacterium]
MILPPEKQPMPSDDKRWRLVATAMRRHGYKSHGLIESLHSIQETFGYVSEDALKFTAKMLRVPLSQAYGVASFYHYFNLKPLGRHSCVVCRGTACHIKGSAQILSDLEQLFAVRVGETTEDGSLSLLSAQCLGACGIAPAVVLDGVVMGRAEAESIVHRVEEVVAA